jgi:hypothetical protein
MSEEKLTEVSITLVNGGGPNNPTDRKFTFIKHSGNPPMREAIGEFYKRLGGTRTISKITGYSGSGTIIGGNGFTTYFNALEWANNAFLCKHKVVKVNGFGVLDGEYLCTNVRVVSIRGCRGLRSPSGITATAYIEVAWDLVI